MDEHSAKLLKMARALGWTGKVVDGPRSSSHHASGGAIDVPDSGAQGLLQLLPATEADAVKTGQKFLDAKENLRAASKAFEQLGQSANKALGSMATMPVHFSTGAPLTAGGYIRGAPYEELLEKAKARAAETAPNKRVRDEIAKLYEWSEQLDSGHQLVADVKVIDGEPHFTPKIVSL